MERGARRRRPDHAAGALHGARGDRARARWSSRARATAWSCGIAPPGSPTTPTWRSARLTSPHHLAILLDMPKTHVPVLAGELIEALDPQPGQIAVDCTLGAAGHARLRRRPARARRAADRDRPRPARRGGVRRARGRGALPHALRARRLRRRARRRCSRRACAPTWSTSTSACPRCRSTRASAGSPTPTTRRSTCAWTPRSRSPPPRSSTRGSRAGSAGCCATTARSATPIGSRRRSCGAGAAGDLTTTFELVDAITAAIPAPARFAGGHPGQAHLPGDPDRGQRRADQLEEALPRAWDLLRVGGRLAAISFHSLEDRRVKRFLADRTRGCICPPDLPVCGCGRTPQAELVFRRSVAPTPGEIADNARSKSARLRAARKLSDEEVRA